MSASFDLDAHLRWKAGVILCSLGITGTIFGVASGQVAAYFRHYWREDRGTVKAVVSAVWTLHLLQMALYSYTVARAMVYAHNNLLLQLTLPWTASGQLVVNATLTALVQLFYVVRVSALCRYIAVTVALNLLVAACWGIVIIQHQSSVCTADFAMVVLQALAYCSCVSTTSVSALSDLKVYVAVNNALIAATDIAISFTLVALLMTSRTGGSRLKRMINRLIFYTINTGLMTSVLALLAIVTNLTMDDTLIYVLFSYVGSSLYAVSMVASLNAREDLRNHMAEATGITTIPTIASLRGDGNIAIMEMQNPNRAMRIPPAVFIETSVEMAH